MRTLRFTTTAAVLISLAFMPAIPGNTDWFRAFGDRVVEQGQSAMLPPHLSLVLGLGDGMNSLPVRQLGIRTSHEVRTFNVATVDGKRVVVLMNYNEETKITQALLLRRGQHLDTAVTYAAGAPPDHLSGTQARAALTEELHYWQHAGTLK
jgi:hypothetical protein